MKRNYDQYMSDDSEEQIGEQEEQQKDPHPQVEVDEHKKKENTNIKEEKLVSD